MVVDLAAARRAKYRCLREAFDRTYEALDRTCEALDELRDLMLATWPARDPAEIAAGLIWMCSTDVARHVRGPS